MIRERISYIEGATKKEVSSKDNGCATELGEKGETEKRKKERWGEKWRKTLAEGERINRGESEKEVERESKSGRVREREREKERERERGSERERVRAGECERERERGGERESKIGI